jgi:hypothetical protein
MANWPNLAQHVSLRRELIEKVLLDLASGELPPYTLAGFDLTTHSSSVLGGRQRRYHKTTPRLLSILVFAAVISARF